MMNAVQEKFLTSENVAQTLKVNIMTIYRYIKSGKLRAYKIGKEFRITEKDFSDFLSKSRIKGQDDK